MTKVLKMRSDCSVGIDDDGRLLTVHVVQYIQAGYSMDHSVLVSDQSQFKHLWVISEAWNAVWAYAW